MGRFPFVQAVIAVAGGSQGDGVEGGGVKGDHRHQNQHQNQRRAGHAADHGDNHAVQVAGLQIFGDKVRLALHLHPHGVVAQHDEAHNGGADAEAVAAQDGLADRPTPGDASDKEGGRYAPHHPVGPVVGGPVLGEIGGAQGVGVGGKADEILKHPSQRLQAGVDDVAGLAAEQQHKGQQPEKEPDAHLGQQADALKAVEQGVGVDKAGDEQDDDGQHRPAQLDAEQVVDDAGHQRGGHAEGGGGSRQQGEHRQQVDDPPGPAVGVFAQNGAAGFGIFLAAALADMEHEAEGRCQHQIEPPGDKAPVEQREHPRPFLNAAQLLNVGVGGVENPLREGVEKDIRRQAAGEHHGTPGEKRVFRLLARVPQDDVPVLGAGDEQGQKKDSQPDDQVVGPEGVAEKEADLAQHGVGLFRHEEEDDAQRHDDPQRHQRDHPVNFFSGQFWLHVAFLLSRPAGVIPRRFPNTARTAGCTGQSGPFRSCRNRPPGPP